MEKKCYTHIVVVVIEAFSNCILAKRLVAVFFFLCSVQLFDVFFLETDASPLDMAVPCFLYVFFLLIVSLSQIDTFTKQPTRAMQICG